MNFLHPFLNPYNLSTGQILFWVVLVIGVAIAGTLTGRRFHD